MSAKLTPGPWHAVDYMARAELVEGPNGQQLAMRQDDASVADMLAMAAAPDLLKALQAILGDMRHEQHHMAARLNSPELFDAVQQNIDAAEAAIRKATVGA